MELAHFYFYFNRTLLTIIGYSHMQNKNRIISEKTGEEK